MLIVILGIAIVALIAFLVLRIKYPSKDSSDLDVHVFFTIMSCLFGLVTLGLVIAICCLSTIAATESTIDSKIEMYQEENANIEQDINKIIKVFPELKSDTLVRQQLELYVSNNAEIKSLKERKIDIAIIKWMLYFDK